MEGMTTQHPTGFICHICEAIAVVELEGQYLCAEHAIESMTGIEIDLREEQPAVATAAE